METSSTLRRLVNSEVHRTEMASNHSGSRLPLCTPRSCTQPGCQACTSLLLPVFRPCHPHTSLQTHTPGLQLSPCHAWPQGLQASEGSTAPCPLQLHTGPCPRGPLATPLERQWILQEQPTTQRAAVVLQCVGRCVFKARKDFSPTHTRVLGTGAAVPGNGAPGKVRTASETGH